MISATVDWFLDHLKPLDAAIPAIDRAAAGTAAIRPTGVSGPV
jgi:hypothetical protein